jgi:hypothetical protein
VQCLECRESLPLQDHYGKKPVFKLLEDEDTVDTNTYLKEFFFYVLSCVDDDSV